MFRARLIVPGLVLWLGCAGIALAAGTTPPRPRVTGPAQVNNRGPLTLQLAYPAQSWSWQSFWHLWYWTQYWHCAPGKDTPPSDIAIQSHPWAGRTAACTLTDNRYLGLGPGQTQQAIPVPREGGVPRTGTWYVRARLVWKTEKPHVQPQPGPWSAWHRVAVLPSFKDVAVPPRIRAPADNQVFSHRDVDVKLAAAQRHPNPARWEFAFEWQRAGYYTKADNAFAHSDPNGFPRQTGLASAYQPWTTPLPVHAVTENGAVATLHMRFADLATGRHDSSYIYRFRVRERIRGSQATGPWSPWRRFIVTDPVTLRPMTRGAIRLKHP